MSNSINDAQFLDSIEKSKKTIEQYQDEIKNIKNPKYANNTPIYSLTIFNKSIDIKHQFTYECDPPTLNFVGEYSFGETNIDLPNDFKYESYYDYDFDTDVVFNVKINDKKFTYNIGKTGYTFISRSNYDERFKELCVEYKTGIRFIKFECQGFKFIFEYNDKNNYIQFRHGSFQMKRDELYETMSSIF